MFATANGADVVNVIQMSGLGGKRAPPIHGSAFAAPYLVKLSWAVIERLRERHRRLLSLRLVCCHYIGLGGVGFGFGKREMPLRPLWSLHSAGGRLYFFGPAGFGTVGLRGLPTGSGLTCFLISLPSLLLCPDAGLSCFSVDVF
jgi:hypothetical protein